MKCSDTNKFIEKANKIHNKKYNYFKFIYINNHIKGIITCPIHGNFLQTPGNHLQYHECPKCAGNLKYTIEKFIEKSNKIHKNKYDYSEVKYINDNTKITIICPNHGKFLQKPYHHLDGKGCKKCQYEKLRLDINKFINSANKIHHNFYDYSKFIYINNCIKGIIICPKHRNFYQTSNSHLSGRGCPKCNFSKGELKIENWLLENKINYIIQKKFDDCRNPKTNYLLKFDFYIPNKNILIEYDGIHHYKNTCLGDLKEIKYRDEVKNLYAKTRNIKLVRISYKNTNKIDEILKNEINYRKDEVNI